MPDIRGLGYLQVQTAELDRWRTFALDGIGWATGKDTSEGVLALRMDERRARLILRAGSSDRVLAVGWEMRDRSPLERVQAAIEDAGIKVRTLSDEEADERAAEAVITFDDPAGTPVEVYFGPGLDHSPVVTPFGSRFVTGAQGMGHVVLPTTAFAATEEFYTRMLGFLPRGAIRIGRARSGPRPRVRFLGVNQRHHSLALVPAPRGEAPGLVHLMVEVRAPGGWDIELGWDGIRVDEAYYTAEEITADSYWGHDWSGTEPLAAFIPPDR